LASYEENGLHMAVMLRCPSSAHKQGIGRTKVIRTPAACVADSGEGAGDAPKWIALETVAVGEEAIELV
jgi:hypothetical protein